MKDLAGLVGEISDCMYKVGSVSEDLAPLLDYLVDHPHLVSECVRLLLLNHSDIIARLLRENLCVTGRAETAWINGREVPTGQLVFTLYWNQNIVTEFRTN